jgi:hypothetical protein
LQSSKLPICHEEHEGHEEIRFGKEYQKKGHPSGLLKDKPNAVPEEEEGQKT